MLVYVYDRTPEELTEALLKGAKFFGTPEGEAERQKQIKESGYEGDTLF